MRYEIKLMRACLFDLNRESTTTDVTFLKYVYLEKVKDEYRYMINIFEDNICRKVMGDETKFCGTKGSKRSAVEIVTNRTCKGRRPTAYYNKIIIDDIKKEYQEALDCTNESDFRKVSAKIANRYASDLRYPKGIICFLQFTFQLTRKDVQKFIAILNADYKTDIVHYDDKEILDYLKNVFEDDFKSTVIYPYIKEEIIKKREVIKNGKKVIESESQLKVDANQLKIHVKPQYDPLIYQVAGTKEPVDVQEKVINTYEKNISEVKTLNQLKQTSEKEFELADFDVKVGDNIKFKVNAKEFTDSIKIVHTDFGEGVIIKNKEVKVLLGKHDLFSEGKIKKYAPEDLIKDDK